MVRTTTAGVFAGLLESLDGQIGVMRDARRIWYWDGAATLSQLAMEGTKSPEKCKFPQPVDAVMLMDIIEIIPMTPTAIASIAKVPLWKR